jgi:dipeptidyl aminopeptidase/acylaminoacyl peptidase
MAEVAPQWSMAHRIGYLYIQEVALSPDGSQVACAISEPLLTDAKSEYVTHLYRAPASGGGLQQLTFGECGNHGPRWSPDGRYLAFVSQRSGKGNLYVMRADGGEAWALTRGDKSDVGQVEWAPDGLSLAFTMAEPPSEEKEKARKAKDDAVVWGVDFDFQHLYVVPFAVAPRTPAAPRQVTHGRYSVVGFAWLPAGSAGERRIAFTHRPTPSPDAWPQTRAALVAVDGEGAEPLDLGPAADYSSPPHVSPDGRWIACATADEPVRWAFASRVVAYSADGGSSRHLATTPDHTASVVGWSADSREVYALDSAGVTAHLWALPLSGESARQLGDGDLMKYLATGAGSRIAYVGQDFDSPNAVYLFDAASGETTEVARPPLPAEWPTAPLPRCEVIHWQAADGQQIEGILTYPLGYEPGRRYPMVVHVHGGPAGAFGRFFVAAPDGTGADLAVLAERGYAVLQPNPRGSGGYGREFRFANAAALPARPRGDWGGGDFADVMAGVDYAIAAGIADPERLAIQGWSYGGFLTSWAIGHTDRFKAAVVGAGVTDLISMTGTCDIPGFVPDYFGCEFWDDFEAYRAHSPALTVKGTLTPTLILHGDQDLRVPLSQGRELYNTLKRHGTPVELVIYPRAEHAPGEPRQVLDINRRTIEWILRWTGRDESTDCTD